MRAALPRGLAICCLFVLILPQPAAAEWHFTPMLGATFFGETNIFDPDRATKDVRRNFGGSVVLLGGGILGAEGVVVWTPGFFTGELDLVRKSRTIAVMGNVVLTTPRRWTEYSLRPFVSGGFGVLTASKTEVADVFSTNRNIPAFNVGGGAIGFLSKSTGLRFDFRYYSSLTRYDETVSTEGPFSMRYMTASVGLVLRR
jgi:hypothetical protein